MFKSAFRTKLWLLIFTFLVTVSSAVFANKPSSITVNDPSYSNGTPAKAGDTVSVSITFESDITPEEAIVYDITSISEGGAKLVLSISKLTGTMYSASGQFTVKTGSTNGNFSATVYITNSDGTNTKGITFKINNAPPDPFPSIDGTPTVTVTRGEAAPEASTIVMAGDKVKISLSTVDADTKTVNLDLSAFNLSTVQASSNDKQNYTYEFTVPTGLSNGNKTIRIELIDEADQKTSYDKNPTIVLNLTSNTAFSSILITNTSGNDPILPGDTIKFTVKITSYKLNKITISSGITLVDNALGLPKTIDTPLGNPSLNGTAEYVFTTASLPTVPGCTYSNITFTISSKATFLFAENTETTAVLNKTLDLGGFEQGDVTVSIVDKNGHPSTSVATISSIITFTTEITNGSSGGSNDVTVDLSALGESTPLILNTTNGTTYSGSYTIKTTNTAMQGQSVVFKVTATNQNGKTLTKNTSAITIDNVPPTLVNFTVTGGTGSGGIVKYYDTLTFTVTSEGAYSASVDLTSLDGTGELALTGSGDSYQNTHIVGLGTTNNINYTFVGKAFDEYGNYDSKNVVMTVDNNPPRYVSSTYSHEGPAINAPYYIIGDKVNVSLALADYTDIPADGVKLDLSSMNGDEYYGQRVMNTSGGGIYTIQFTIATGPLNLGATFPIIITDNAGNGLIPSTATGVGDERMTASISIPLFDQNPPDPMTPTFTIVSRSPKKNQRENEFPNIINSWTTIDFNLTYDPTDGDNATATVILPQAMNRPTTDSNSNNVLYLQDKFLHQLLPVGSTSDYAYMNLANSSYTVQIVTEESNRAATTSYSIPVIMTDISGNKRLVYPPTFTRIDLKSPVISDIKVTTSRTGTLLIGDTVTFEVTVNSLEGNGIDPDIFDVPTIDLSNIDSTLSFERMEYISIGQYKKTVKIATGTINNVTASCAILVYDQAFNFDASYTREITVDNVPPEISEFKVTTGNNSNTINYTTNSQETASVTFVIKSKENDITVTYDATAIGGSATEASTMTGPDANGDYLYSFGMVTDLCTEEFSDYKFVATAKDSNNNPIIVESNEFTKVDCVVPEFVPGESIATITARNASLPKPSEDLLTDVARIGDTISFYASMTNNIGATASVEICIDPVTPASITRELTYNSSLNCYETSLVIKSAGTKSDEDRNILWSELTGSIAYRFVATDSANNIATPSTGLTDFNVSNTLSTISSFSLLIDPNYDSTVILNVGSGTAIEYLIASATLADGRIASSAYIDLSSITGAPNKYELASITGSVINSAAPGINLNLYPTDDWYETPVPITITVLDNTGYSCATTSSLIRIDTKQPEITQAAFDGTDLKIMFSEEIHEFEGSRWAILGSTTSGLTESISLGDPELATIDAPIIYGNEVTVTLTRAAQTTYVSWDSGPIYLQCTNSSSVAAVKDKALNWINPTTLPINVTSFILREEPEISLFKMEHDWNWPTASITFTVQFTHEMATTTSFIASEGVLFVDAPEGVSSFNDVSYADWYVFQAEDKFTWLPEGSPDNKTLKITLCDSGRDWIASNLTNNPEKVIKFAQYSGKRMIKNVFNKALKQYTIDAPFYVEDDRASNPLPHLNVLSDNPKPVINMASGTLTIGFKDRAKLFTNPFRTKNETDPALDLPDPTDSKASTRHLSNISLFNLENDTSIVLECKPIVKTKNPEYASTTVTIDLTDNDLNNILNFYNSYDTQVWGLQINEGSFVNVWNETSTKYKPTSPGTVELIKASPTATATIIACSVSDMPPTKEDTGNFTFDFELTKSEAGVLKLPFLTTASPTAGIFETSTSARIASATLTGWSTRTVKGVERTIATFKTDENFTKPVNGIEAELRIYSLKDVFGNEIPVQVASYVYDVTKRSATTETGFSTASAPFSVDNVLPTVVSVTPTLVGLTNISQPMFKVEFSEEMDTNVTPTLNIATGSTKINCSFDSWEASGTIAVFKNDRAITATTPNGNWAYNITGAMDWASNSLEPTEVNVVIKSEVPRVTEETLHIYTIRKNIDNNVVVKDKPFNFDASPDYVKITYQYADSNTENLPHTANFYNISNELIGSSTVSQDGINATATLKAEYFTSVPTNNTKIHVKIQDCAGNETNTIGSLNYYGNPPVIKTLTIDEVASATETLYFYSPAVADANMNLRAIFKESYTGLSMLLASYSIPMSPVATMTVGSNLEGLTLTSTFGKELEENLYLLAFADEAGNLATGLSQKFIVADNTPPTVISVTPGPSDEVANCDIGMATFTVVFNELMDTTKTPFLSIATASKKIATSFVGWGSDGMTASFTNAEIINSQIPAGEYKYVITGAKDMTGHQMNTTPATCTTIIWPAGPGVSSLTISALMPDLDENIVENRSYNPDKYKTGYGDNAASVTFKVDYVNTPTYDPHKLVIYDSSDNEIASLSIVITGRTGTTIWNAADMPLTDGNYSFRMLDKLGNYFPENGYLDQTFTIDTTEPNITSVAVEDGNIGMVIDGIKYYSPSVPATFTVTTSETEELQLIIASGTATATYVITPDNGSYTISLNDKIQPSWHGNDFILKVSDMAGNINESASVTIRIDSLPPQVTLATAVDETDNPIFTVGKVATVKVTFDSVLNQNFKPTVAIATETLGVTEIATLTFSQWIDEYTCKYTTNGVFDSINYPVGTSSIMVSDARDIAGNLVESSFYGVVEVISKSPDFYATLESKQTMISDATLTNRTLSLNAEPNVATITILYNKGPYALDHQLLVFDNAGEQIATHTLTDGATSITVDSAFFGTTDVSNYTGTFTVKLRDAMQNLSLTASTSLDTLFVINYDSIAPDISSFEITGMSSASTSLTNYYNPDLCGSATCNVELTASDALRLIVYGVASSPYEAIATRTFDMPLTNALTYSYTGDLSDIYGQNLPEGTYVLQVADTAGNIPADYKNLIIDKTGPVVKAASMIDSTYISSGEAGMATFSIQFNEAMFEAAYQYLEIATTTYKIPCRFVRMDTTDVASDTAIFETAVAVPNTILQGDYQYHVIGTDLTGNKTDIATGSVFVKSAGPVVSTIKTFSYQATTASDTLDSGKEYHYDDLFSFNVEPNAATMSIKLAEEPDGDPSKVYVTFLKQISEYGTTKEVFVASHAVDVTDLMATFTWDASTEPLVATEASYIIRISDSNNDLSGYSYKWDVDNVAPTYSSIAFTSGINFPASETIYINPYRHTNFEITFLNLSDHAPKLRLSNGVSTDTYPLTAINSTTNWKTAFRGRYSRETSSADNLMPDGIYSIGLVDQAGNEAASGTTDLYSMVIDTKSPVIGTYSFIIAGQPVADSCSPSAERPMTISMETDETLTATGAYYLDVYNSGEVRINRLNLTQNGSKLEAVWNGTNDSGVTAADGKYTFRASDLCGNTASNSASITAITAAFQNMGAVQIGSNTIEIWFNHIIDGTSLTSSTITSSPALSISNPVVYDERAICFNAANMTHGASYTLTISSSLKDIYGSPISASSTTAVFTADVKGPELITYNFNNSNNQSEITLVFDQVLDKESAEKPGSYIITDSTGAIVPISSVLLQGDKTNVLICASGTFEEKSSYTVRAYGVTDELGNGSCGKSTDGSFTFVGRDITPPTFKVSAFSNAANENDIIVIAVSSEELKRAPTLTIKHGNTSPMSLTMQKSSSNSCAFMAAASLKASNGKSGSLLVNGEDLNGNSGVGEGAFTIATVATKSNTRLATADDQFSLTFDENSLKSDTTVRILQRSIEKDEIASGTIETALQGEYDSMRGARASVTTANEAASNAELTPLTDAYEATLNSKKVNKGAVAAMRVPESASATTGLGLFYQKNGSWKFISSNITAEKEIKAKITSTQVFAIMRDSVAPTIKLDDSMDLTKNFETSRPEFIGSIKDFGSGIDTNSVEVKIDNNTQLISVGDDGSFKFRPLTELTNGNHELSINACDHTGNAATTGSMRFALTLPFEFKQIIQYPNPARNHTTIRIRTNSTGVNCNIKVKIYDVAGHKVADFDESDVVDKRDGNYEIRWDLTNTKGKRVANGTYIAKLEATNPETGKKTKKTLKLAVLK